MSAMSRDLSLVHHPWPQRVIIRRILGYKILRVALVRCGPNGHRPVKLGRPRESPAAGRILADDECNDLPCCRIRNRGTRYVTGKSDGLRISQVEIEVRGCAERHRIDPGEQ